MRDSDAWLDRLEELCSRYETSLQSSSTVDSDLRALLSSMGSPIDAVSIEIQRQQPFQIVYLGSPGAGDPSDTETKQSGEQFTYKIRIWRNRLTAVDLDRLRKLLLRLPDAHFKMDLHDRVSGLLSFQYPKTKELLENTIAASAQNLYILFTDLDQFKQLVNDPFGQDGGDSAIFQFAALLDRISRPDAIPIHRSGDEFCGVLFSRSPLEALSFGMSLISEVKNTVFNVKGNEIHFGTTVGLTAVPSGTTVYTEIEALAVKSIKPSTGKQRGKIRFSLESGRTEHVALSDTMLLEALCEIKTNIPMHAPFASPALNIISSKVFATLDVRNMSLVQMEVEHVIQATTIDVVDSVLQSSLGYSSCNDVSMKASNLDIAFAVAHGVYRVGFKNNVEIGADLEIQYSRDTGAVKLVTGDHIILSRGELLEPALRFSLGGFATRDESITCDPAPRAALIKIGHKPLDISADLFADIIVVDDRPTRGGGLPDFWEATVARLTGLLEQNPNVATIVVIGDTGSAAKIAAMLLNVTNWNEDAEKMAFKTGVTAQAIRSAAERIADHVVFVPTADVLIEELTRTVRQPIVIRPVTTRRQQQVTAFLDRQLSEREIRLGLGDGCRTSTIAKAYPIAIEIVRKTKQSWSAHDESGIELRELTDFKISLTEPTRDKVPAFYRDEEKLLEEYFQREFLSSGGTFGRVFERTGQIEPVLNHLVGTISKEVPATTRRAILIIPHDEGLTLEVAPLGLVCVRIVPRFERRTVRFDYSFVWRTVEALVGLPYSMFGSVRFGEYLTDELVRKLAPHDHVVEMGQVSYIAQSLHMFTDEYGQIIARRIVNDATL